MNDPTLSLLACLLGGGFLIVALGITYAYRRILPYVKNPEGQPHKPPAMLIAIFRNFMYGAYGCYIAAVALFTYAVLTWPDTRPDVSSALTDLPISLYYAGALGLLLVLLTYNVLFHRVKATIEKFGETDPTAERIARVHANFTEYVPTGLALLITIEWAGAPALIVHVAGGLFTAARYLHAYGYTTSEFASFGRIVGIQSTLLALSFMVLTAGYYLFMA